ncbi:YezD family protein [Pseudalkalibacillus sp. A8]
MSKERDELKNIVPRINEMLKTMKFGSVTLVVQDGKVIQIEKNEKVRIK